MPYVATLDGFEDMISARLAERRSADEKQKARELERQRRREERKASKKSILERFR